MDVIEEIKSKVDIVDYISEYVKLKRKGQNFYGLCPFHSEKTPSFIVSPAKQLFYCFGCQTGGNIFAFNMKLNNVSFSEALEALAKRAGVEVKNNGNPKIKRLYEANNAALEFFQREILKSSTALEYLKARGIDINFIEKFKVGYAGYSLVKYLASKGFTDAEIIDAGLGRKSKDGMVDVFCNRVMFPVVSSGSIKRIKGFIGRNIKNGESESKYINSPATAIFNKSKTLYGFNPAAIREKGYVIVVEGVIDALMCHNYGFANTVASLGTAFTEKHLEVLQRYCNKIILVFDGDAAGAFAAKRAVTMMFDRYVDCSVVILPDGEDPDSFLRKGGNLLQLIDKAIPASVFLARFEGSRRMVFSKIMQRPPLQVVEFLAYCGTSEDVEMFSQLSARNFIMPFLRKSPVAFRSKSVEVKKHGDFLVLLNKGKFMFYQPIVSDYKREAAEMAAVVLKAKRKAGCRTKH